MSLADHKPPAPMHGKPCSIGSLLDQLDGAELAAFESMLGAPESPGWPAAAVWEACRAEGYEIGLQSVNRHRGRRCRCFRGQS